MVMASELRTLAIRQIPNFVETPDNLVKFFIDRVRSNLHVILCMSPVSSKFAERARRFPGIIGGMYFCVYVYTCLYIYMYVYICIYICI
jgi:dynein heavy chain